MVKASRGMFLCKMLYWPILQVSGGLRVGNCV